MKILIIFITLFLPFLSYTQDIDKDNINDRLEQELALKFAPEWRFNKHKSGDDSNQNDNEEYYPCSPEWLQSHLAFMGNSLKLSIRGNEQNIDIRQICDVIDPVTNQSVCYSDIDFKTDDYQLVYPKHVHGDPDGFPTYYNCRIRENQIKITYMLFYPYDFKADNLANNKLSNHRGDWVGLSVVLNQMPFEDLKSYDPQIITTASTDYVMYGGHGPNRYISANSSNYFHRGNHPMAFVTWGSHGVFPQPGEFHNYEVIGFVCSTVDDYFLGNGLVVQSWHEDREILNLGEVANPHPEREWLIFKGLWGADDDNGSPGSPATKGIYYQYKNHESWDSWENLLVNEMNGQWCGELKTHQSIPSNGCDGWYSNLGPIAILWDGGNATNGRDTWDGAYNLLSGPAEFPNSDVIGDHLHSALLLGGVEVHLFDQTNFRGNRKVLTQSTPGFHFDVKSLKILPSSRDYVCDHVVSKENSSDSGNTDGSWLKPYSTITGGVQSISNGSNLCIKAGYYQENIMIDKSMIIRAIGGTVTIGE